MRVIRLALSALLVLLVSFSFAGCAVSSAAGSMTAVPRERTTECHDICKKLGLRLSAVVVIMSHAGCVCETTAAQASRSSAAVAGGAAIQAAIQAQQQQQQQQQSQPKTF